MGYCVDVASAVYDKIWQEVINIANHNNQVLAVTIGTVPLAV